MFVDACAIVSLMSGEATAPAYEAALLEAEAAWTSALAAFEAIIILSKPEKLNLPYVASADAVVAWLDQREPAPPRQVLSHAVAVAQAKGLGKRALSIFDCFHYGCAKAEGHVLLTLDQLLRDAGVATLP